MSGPVILFALLVGFFFEWFVARAVFYHPISDECRVWWPVEGTEGTTPDLSQVSTIGSTGGQTSVGYTSGTHGATQ